MAPNAFGSTLTSFLRSLTTESEDPGDVHHYSGAHVLLFSRDYEALHHIIGISAGVDGHNLEDEKKRTPEVQRVHIPHVLSAGPTPASRRVDVTYVRFGKAMILDVNANIKAMDGLAPFLNKVVSTQDVTHAHSSSKSRRVIVIINSHRMSPVCQLAMRRIVENAAFNTWLVLTAPCLSSIETALAGRFVCINATPEKQHTDVKYEKDDPFIEKLIVKLARAKTCAQMESVSKVPRSEVGEEGVAGFFMRVIKYLSSERAGLLRDREDDEMPRKKKLHIYASDLATLVSRLACLEKTYAQTERLLACTSANDCENYSTISVNQCAAAALSRLLTLACSEVRLCLCPGGDCCDKNRSERFARTRCPFTAS